MSRVNEVLQVGMAAPAFDLPDPWGKRIRLDALTAEGPAIVSFHRGTWCSNCRKFLKQLSSWSKEYAGSKVALVLCQNRDAVASFFDGDEVPYEVLVDETRDVAKAYGVHVLLGLDSVNIARPATFVIDRERVVRFVFVASHQWESFEEGPMRDAMVALR